VPWASAARSEAEESGKKVLLKHQCNRCHEIENLEPTKEERPLHCTGCHTFLKGLKPESKQFKEIAAKYGEGILERYQRNIVHLEKAPSLTGIARRVRADWLRDFLKEPYDVRPALEESMIRHRLGDDEIRAVVRYFAAKAEAADPYAEGYRAPALPPRPDAARIEEGKKLFTGRGCPTCHAYGNMATGVEGAQLKKVGLPAALAPNLRFVRDRTHPEVLLDWVRDPQLLAPGTLMPPTGLSRDEALVLRDFLLWGDPALDKAPLPEPQMPPAAARPVSYEEMKERVLGNVCVHCHMNDYEKDTGPGNTGGFGYQGIKLAMRTYETLVGGAVDEQGKRYSVLVPRPGESSPPILTAMLRRRHEEARDHLEPGHDRERAPYPKTPPGMPMGLPSMSDEQFGLLRAWIEQGCVGPEKVTGKAGVNDGYLVPDGPIRKNKGCELRGLETPRPAWAYDQAAPGASASASASARPAPARKP